MSSHLSTFLSVHSGDCIMTKPYYQRLTAKASWLCEETVEGPKIKSVGKAQQQPQWLQCADANHWNHTAHYIAAPTPVVNIPQVSTPFWGIFLVFLCLIFPGITDRLLCACALIAMTWLIRREELIAQRLRRTKELRKRRDGKSVAIVWTYFPIKR